MSANINRAITYVAIYVAQLGALWGVLEGYTYFKGDALKEWLGSFWVLIYILPLFTTIWFIWWESRVQEAKQETITTSGDFSPGKVGQDYAVGAKLAPSPACDTRETPQPVLPAPPSQAEHIATEGHYSPGKVDGNYTIRSAAAIPPAAADTTSDRPNVANPVSQPGKTIRTKGTYSPGEVGGDYTIEH